MCGSKLTPSPHANSSIGELCLVALGFTVLALLGTYPLAIEAHRALPNDLGDPVLNAWILAWDADRIRHGLQGLWDAPNFFPSSGTLTYSENLLGIAVFTAPLQWVLGNPVLVYNVAVIFSYVLAGTGMYLLAFSLTGSRVGAIVSAVAFAFLPYRVAHWPHLQILMVGWMPVGLYALHRYFDSGSRLALLGFAAAFLLQSLSNGHFIYFFAVPVTMVAIAELFRSRRTLKRLVPELVVATLLILLVLAPVALAYFQTHEQYGLGRSRAQIVSYSADLVSYMQVTPTLLVWGDVLPIGAGERELFPGFVLLVLAVVGLVYGASRSLSAIPWLTPRHRLRPHDLKRFRIRYVVRLYAAIAVVAVVLSLGPEPTVFGRVLMSSGPYDWLLATVPGLDGLRVPSRIAVVVYLALAVLASIGVAGLTHALAPRAALAVCLVLGGVTFTEGYAPMQMRPFDPPTNVDRHNATKWLTQAPPGAVLELPLGTGFQHTLNNVRYQYATLEHRHPVVNGFSGYSSRLMNYLSSREGELLDYTSPLNERNHLGQLLRGLRSLGVRYVVVNETLYDNESDAIALLEAIRSNDRQLVTTKQFGFVTVFQLTDWREPIAPDLEALVELPLSTYRVSTSHQQSRWPRAVDRNKASRWLSGSRQTGREWIEVNFDRSRDVGLLRLGLGEPGLSDYPRRLLIETIDEQGEVQQRLYRGGVMPQLLQGVLKNQRWIDIDVFLPANTTRTLRIRQTASTRKWYWSIHEFSIWTRPRM